MLTRILAAVCRRLCPCDCGTLPRPGTLKQFTLISEVFPMTGLQCKGEFPPIVADDHAKWGVNVEYTYPNPDDASGEPLTAVNNFEVQTSKTSPTADCIFVVHKESNGTVKLRAIDKKGNASEFGAPVSFNATDTFPPPTPGAFNIAVTGEAELPAEPTP